jgi:tetratricopeptide (TPR) repeat protein
MRLLVENRSHQDLIPALNRAEAVLAHERVAETASRLSGIGQAMSRDGQKQQSLLYLRAAAEMRAAAIDFHWLGSTLAQLGKPEEAIPFLEKAVALRGLPQDYEWLGDARAEIESKECWFCGEHAPDTASVVTVHMHKVTSKTPAFGGGWSWRWNNMDVAVPCCTDCKLAHVSRNEGRLNKAGYVGAVLGALAGLLGILAGGLVIFTVPVGLVAGLFVARALAKGSMPPPRGKSESAKLQFPAVQRRLAEGWMVGKEPAEVTLAKARSSSR